MDMKKEETNKFQINPGKVSKNPRNKRGYSVTVEGQIVPLIVRILEGTNDAVPYNDESINLCVAASSEHWQRLQKFISDHPYQFTEQFETIFINPAVEKNTNEKKYFINKLKKESSVLYKYFSYWCERGLSDWPKFLEKIIRQIETDNCIIKNRKGKYDPQEMTEYCLRKVYRSKIEKYKLTPFDDPTNFRITYIQEGKRAAALLARTMDNKTLQEITQLAYNYPFLKPIFKKLNVL
jgi:hypothetical protein